MPSHKNSMVTFALLCAVLLPGIVAQAQTTKDDPYAFSASLTEAAVGQLEARVDELYINFHWCLWHEGVRIFDDAVPGNLRDINTIRNECVSKQSHNPGAQAMIRSASNDLLTGLAHRAAGSTGEHQLWENFRWVAYHEGQRDAFRDALSKGDFGRIRSIYSTEQSHNPNARNLLAEVSNGTLRAMVNSL